ncbi:MAG: silent information regulator protein Sir2 [Verrucomicrobiota bacterium]
MFSIPAGANKVYLSWRLLRDDAAEIAFNVYRQPAAGGKAIKLNAQPVFRTTDFMDSSAPIDIACEYFVRGVLASRELEAGSQRVATASAKDPIIKNDSKKPAAPEAAYVSIPLLGKYKVQSVAVADLDGDGRMDFVIKQPDGNIDPYKDYWHKSAGTFKLEAYRHDGKPLWQYDLGWGIEQGIWYAPYIVHDFDGCGKAEVVVKTGEGDPRDQDGRVQTGPEYLAVLDGYTGKEICRAEWPARELFKDEGYNHASRNQLSVAYLDGKTPSIIINRGTYGHLIVEAWQFHDRKLERQWRWDNKGLHKQYQGQGSHMLQAADLNGDGRDEIIVGSCVISANGKELWTTGLGHPDSVYVGKLNPNRKGLQIYYNIETAQKSNSMCQVDAATGKILWGFGTPTKHVHSHGLCSDIDPDQPGWEGYGAESTNHVFVYSRLWNSTGKLLDDSLRWSFGPFAVLWDETPQRALILNSRITKYKGAVLNAVDANFLAVADVLGDWREEIIATVPGELRVYTTTIPARDRHVWLMQDPIYRNCVIRQTSGYYQCPTMSFDLATGATRNTGK